MFFLLILFFCFLLLATVTSVITLWFVKITAWSILILATTYIVTSLYQQFKGDK